MKFSVEQFMIYEILKTKIGFGIPIGRSSFYVDFIVNLPESIVQYDMFEKPSLHCNFSWQVLKKELKKHGLKIIRSRLQLKYTDTCLHLTILIGRI